MPRYDWNNRFKIETSPCTYSIYNKWTGGRLYDGKAYDARLINILNLLRVHTL